MNRSRAIKNSNDETIFEYIHDCNKKIYIVFSRIAFHWNAQLRGSFTPIQLNFDCLFQSVRTFRIQLFEAIAESETETRIHELLKLLGSVNAVSKKNEPHSIMLLIKVTF